MKLYTIKNSFRDSEMWPYNPEADIKKMRLYAKGTKGNKKGKKNTYLSCLANEAPN